MQYDLALRVEDGVRWGFSCSKDKVLVVMINL